MVKKRNPKQRIFILKILLSFLVYDSLFISTPLAKPRLITNKHFQKASLKSLFGEEQ